MQADNNMYAQKINQELSRQLTIMQESIFGGCVIAGGQTGDSYIFISEGFARLQGYTPQELIQITNGSTWNNILPEDRPATKKIWTEQLAKGDTFSFCYRAKHKNGSIIYLQNNGLRVIEPTGETRFYVVLQDITKNIMQNIELKNLIGMQKQMVECMPCGVIAYTKKDKNLLILNKEAQRIMGLSSAEGKADIDKMANVTLEDKKEVIKKIASLKNVGDSFIANFRTVHKDKTVVYVECKANLLQFENGDKFVLAVLQDATQWTLLTQKLQQEQIDNLNEADNSLKDSLRIIKSFSSIYFATWSINLLTNKIKTVDVPKWLDVIDQDHTGDAQKAFDYMVSRFITDKTSRQQMKGFLQVDSLRNRMKDEQLLSCEYISCVTKEWRSGNFIVIDRGQNGLPINVLYAIRNIDSAKRRELDSEKALKLAFASANRANAAKTDFLSRMSHDIRTPMNAIIGLTAIAGTHLNDPARLEDCLAKINISSKHLLSLINEVLDMSRIESGKVALTEEPFNLSSLIDDLLVIIKPQITAKQHHLHVHIKEVEHENVIGDALRLQQVFVNILGNAAKYTPEGGDITLNVRERMTKSSITSCYEFEVQDNGIGMSAKFLKRVFEPFERDENQQVSKIQGTGLGMSIAKNIVNMMNGDIKVKSTVGKGSCFTVTVYLKLQDNSIINNETFPDLSVLVVDDDLISCQSADLMLKSIGMKSQYVQSGKDAIQLVVKRHENKDDFFAVIIDWQMPQMDGIETTKQIRKLVGPDVPVIIFTSYDWSDIEQEARAAGVDMFVSKPLFKSKLVYTFNTILGKKQETTIETEQKKDFVLFPGKRVLLAEDNELNAEIAKEILEMMQLKVDVASDGKQALDAFLGSSEGFYDLVFLDIQMPIMNGYETASAIRVLSRKDAKSLPIIAMTANAFAEDVIAAKNAGMNEHIAKPLDIEKLKQILKNYLK